MSRVSTAAAKVRDDADAMRRALARHGSDAAVAAAVGVRHDTVGRWRRAHGIEQAGTPGPRMSTAASKVRDDADAMRRALARHGSDVAVAEAVGSTKNTVGRWRAAHGLTPGGGPAPGPKVNAAAAQLRDDPDAMRAALGRHGSDVAVAETVGASAAAVRRWRISHRIPAGGR